MRLPLENKKIRKGQYWRKKDSGVTVRLVGHTSGDRWCYKKIGKTGVAHAVGRKELLMFWEKL